MPMPCQQYPAISGYPFLLLTKRVIIKYHQHHIITSAFLIAQAQSIT